MPVRSLNSSVLRWPDRETVLEQARKWCERVLSDHLDALKAGFRGSYARGTEGVGSDLDLVVVLKSCELPFHRRCLLFETSSLPVPADLLVYTEEEFGQILARGDKFAGELKDQTVWFARGDGKDS